jgi:hypothetical protein
MDGDHAISSPTSRDFAPKSPRRHLSGSMMRRDKTLQKPNRKSSSEFDFDEEFISEEDEIDESSSSRADETVDMEATEVDVFSAYSWSTAKQDARKIHMERQQLRDSIRDTPFYRAYRYARSRVF